MTINEVKELQTYDILSCKWDTVIQILKQISDGYIVLNYSQNHRVFNTAFKSFEDIISDEYEIDDGLWEYEFKGESIRHIDEFGFCKPID